jgi:hypothetical protein
MEQGHKEGLWLTFYENGRLESNTEYRSGKPVGAVVEYYRSGKPVSVQFFNKKGQQHGPWLHWLENGQMTDGYPLFFLNDSQVDEKDFAASCQTDDSLIKPSLLSEIPRMLRLAEAGQPPSLTGGAGEFPGDILSLPPPGVEAVIPTNGESKQEFRMVQLRVLLKLGVLKDEKQVDLERILKEEDFRKKFDGEAAYECKDVALEQIVNTRYVDLLKGTSALDTFRAECKKQMNNLLQKHGLKPRIESVIIEGFAIQ